MQTTEAVSEDAAINMRWKAHHCSRSRLWQRQMLSTSVKALAANDTHSLKARKSMDTYIIESSMLTGSSSWQKYFKVCHCWKLKFTSWVDKVTFFHMMYLNKQWLPNCKKKSRQTVSDARLKKKLRTCSLWSDRGGKNLTLQPRELQFKYSDHRERTKFRRAEEVKDTRKVQSWKFVRKQRSKKSVYRRLKACWRPLCSQNNFFSNLNTMMDATKIELDSRFIYDH